MNLLRKWLAKKGMAEEIFVIILVVVVLAVAIILYLTLSGKGKGLLEGLANLSIW